MPKKRDRWIVGGLCLLGSLVALTLFVRSMPAVTDREARDIEEEIEHARADLVTVVCERSPHRLPGDEPYDETLSARLFFEEGELSACIDAGWGEEVFRELQEGERRWVLSAPASDGDESSVVLEVLPIDRTLAPLEMYPPHYPPGGAAPHIEAVRASCSTLLPILRRLASGPGECSPIHPSSDLWQAHLNGTLVSVERLLGLARAAVIMSRMAADSAATLHHLIDAVVVLRDLRSGPTSYQVVSAEIRAERTLWGGFQSELIATRGSLGARGEIAGRIERLLDSVTSDAMPLDAMPLDAVPLDALQDAGSELRRIHRFPIGVQMLLHSALSPQHLSARGSVFGRGSDARRP